MKKAAPLLAILFVASAPFVRTEAQTATKTQTAGSTSQASRQRPADATAQPELCNYLHARDGKTITWAGLEIAQ